MARTHRNSTSLLYVCLQTLRHACQHTSTPQLSYGIVLAYRILARHIRERIHLANHWKSNVYSTWKIYTQLILNTCNSCVPKRSLPMRRRTAVHGRSVFSKQRHHSRGVIVLSWSKSHVSKNGLMQRSFWSCSKSYISCVDKKPSLFKSKWPNIHLASFLQAAGNRAVIWQELEIFKWHIVVLFA